VAFSPEEKRKIRSYLGYSGGFRDRGVRLESMMDVVGAQTDEYEYALTLLDQIDAVDTALNETGTTQTSTITGTGALKKVDEVEYYAPKDSVVNGEVISGATTAIVGRDWGEILIERLRALFGVELAGRYFRKGGGCSGPFQLG
jgi:hypothetical protein